MSNKIYKPGEVDLDEVLNQYKIEIFEDLHCHSIGEIIDFNVNNQTATIKSKFKKNLNNKIIEYPLLIKCPCVIINGGKASLRMPISKGDNCLVFFNDENIDNWFLNGEGNIPDTIELHDISNAIALVGIFNLQNCLSDYSNTEAGLIYDKTKILIENNLIKIENATYNLKSILDELITTLSNLTTIPAVVGTPLTLAPIAITQLNTIKSKVDGLLK